METDFIQGVIEQLLSQMSVNARFSGVSTLQNMPVSKTGAEQQEGSEITKFSITTEEPHLLIGTDGKTLFALNHVVKKMYEQAVAQKRMQPMHFLVYVNDFQERRIDELKNRAHMMAERARYFKSSIEMPPMNPYERMLVHSFFSETSDITTESTGFGKQRRIVLKYTGA